MTADFERSFEGMTEEPVTLAQLKAARETFITHVVSKMPDAHRKFLISFVRGAPDWSSIDLPDATNLPAVKFRQLNLDKLTQEKRDAEIAALEKVLAQ
jgi:hypothetical protein